MYIDRERASFAKIQRKRIPDTWDMCRSSGMTEKLQGVLYSLHRGGRRREGETNLESQAETEPCRALLTKTVDFNFILKVIKSLKRF